MLHAGDTHVAIGATYLLLQREELAPYHFVRCFSAETVVALTYFRKLTYLTPSGFLAGNLSFLYKEFDLAIHPGSSLKFDIYLLSIILSHNDNHTYFNLENILS